MLVKNKYNASQIYLNTFYVCIICYIIYYVSFVQLWDMSNIKAIWKLMDPHIFVPIKSLVSYRINVLWSYYIITGNCMVMLTYMTLIIVVKNYILHIIYNYCQYSILLITVYTVYCSLLSHITTQNFLVLISLIKISILYS